MDVTLREARASLSAYSFTRGTNQRAAHIQRFDCATPLNRRDAYRPYVRLPAIPGKCPHKKLHFTPHDRMCYPHPCAAYLKNHPVFNSMIVTNIEPTQRLPNKQPATQLNRKLDQGPLIGAAQRLANCLSELLQRKRLGHHLDGWNRASRCNDLVVQLGRHQNTGERIKPLADQ